MCVQKLCLFGKCNRLNLLLLLNNNFEKMHRKRGENLNDYGKYEIIRITQQFYQLKDKICQKS